MDGKVEVRELTYTYTGAAAPALRDISFELAPGEILGCLGPSGAGKSTLQNCMIGLLPISHGSISYDGNTLAGLGKEFFNRIGVSFEHPNLYSRLTGLENLRYHSALYSGKIRPLEALLETLGLGDALNQRVEEYSKGMKQRLVFARSLMHMPDILFLDEPTAGLDPGLADRVKDMILQEQQRGAAILLTTHDMHVAEEICDRVAFINDGELVALDTPRNLKMMHGEKSVVVEYRENGGTRRKVLMLDSQRGREALNVLIDAGNIETIHSNEASLGRVFITLTGRGLGE